MTGHPAKSSRFERDKFTGYLFAPFVDALTDDRRHIEMRGCRYTAPPLTSTGSVVYRTLRGYCNKFCKCTKGRRFHNHVGAFRRKADYTQMKHGMKSCCPLVSDECCFYDATEWILSLELFSVTVSRSADPNLDKSSTTQAKIVRVALWYSLRNYWMASFRALPRLKAGTFAAAISMASPVWELRS